MPANKLGNIIKGPYTYTPPILPEDTAASAGRREEEKKEEEKKKKPGVMSRLGSAIASPGMSAFALSAARTLTSRPQWGESPLGHVVRGVSDGMTNASQYQQMQYMMGRQAWEDRMKAEELKANNNLKGAQARHAGALADSIPKDDARQDAAQKTQAFATLAEIDLKQRGLQEQAKHWADQKELEWAKLDAAQQDNLLNLAARRQELLTRLAAEKEQSAEANKLKKELAELELKAMQPVRQAQINNYNANAEESRSRSKLLEEQQNAVRTRTDSMPEGMDIRKQALWQRAHKEYMDVWKSQYAGDNLEADLPKALAEASLYANQAVGQGNGVPVPQRTTTKAKVAEYAKDKRISYEEAKRHAVEKGYTVVE